MSEFILPQIFQLRSRLREVFSRRLLWLAVALLVSALLLSRYFEPIGRHIMPLQDIIVRGGDSQSRALAERMLAEARGGNLMNMNVAVWKQKLEALPGIRRAHVQRRLPYALLVQLQSSEPLARWQGGGLVGSDGERYVGNVDEVLPVFRGDSDSVEEMVVFYRQASQLLPGGIAQVELDKRGNWQVFLTDGVLVYLGRRPLLRLRRYIRHAAVLGSRLPRLRAVDMRYAHGFAVQLRQEEEEQS